MTNYNITIYSVPHVLHQYFPLSHLSQWNPRGILGFLPNPSKGQWDSYHIPSSFLACSQLIPTESYLHGNLFLVDAYSFPASRQTSPVFYTHVQLAAPFMLLSFQACMVVWYCLYLQ